MKAKTIKAVISKKVNAWLDSIEDDGVRAIAAKGVIVTGGCICSMLLKEQVNDYDIYLKDHDTVLAVTNYYVEKFKQNNKDTCFGDGRKVDIFVEDINERVKIVVKSAGIAGENNDENYEYFEMNEAIGQQEFLDNAIGNGEEDQAEIAAQNATSDEGKKYRPIYLSTNAITLSDKIQIIIRFYGGPDEIHNNYDFVHCTNYWTSWENNLVLRADALEAIITKELRYIGSKYPLCSIIRTRKFIKRNWHINAGQYVKMCMQLNDLNLTDIKVLEDQLTGVDVAYFIQVIEKCKAKEDLTSAYVIEIIDRMF